MVLSYVTYCQAELFVSPCHTGYHLASTPEITLFTHSAREISAEQPLHDLIRMIHPHDPAPAPTPAPEGPAREPAA